MSSIIHHITLKREFGDEKPEMSYPNMELKHQFGKPAGPFATIWMQIGISSRRWMRRNFLTTFFFCPIRTPIMIFKLGTSRLLCRLAFMTVATVPVVSYHHTPSRYLDDSVGLARRCFTRTSLLKAWLFAIAACTFASTSTSNSLLDIGLIVPAFLCPQTLFQP